MSNLAPEREGQLHGDWCDLGDPHVNLTTAELVDICHNLLPSLFAIQCDPASCFVEKMAGVGVAPGGSGPAGYRPAYLDDPTGPQAKLQSRDSTYFVPFREVISNQFATYPLNWITDGLIADGEGKVEGQNVIVGRFLDELAGVIMPSDFQAIMERYFNMTDAQYQAYRGRVAATPPKYFADLGKPFDPVVACAMVEQYMAHVWDWDWRGQGEPLPAVPQGAPIAVVTPAPAPTIPSPVNTALAQLSPAAIAALMQLLQSLFPPAPATPAK